MNMSPQHPRKKVKTKADNYLYLDYIRALRKWLKEVFLEIDALKKRVETLEEALKKTQPV